MENGQTSFPSEGQNNLQNVSKSEYVSTYPKDDSPICHLEEDKSDVPPKTKSEAIYSEVSIMIPECFQFVKNMKLEAIAFLYIFAFLVRSVSSTTMVVERVCSVHMELSDDVCNNLKDHLEEKTEVERVANNYLLAHSLIQVLPSVFLAVFIGPWSDRYGRKLPFIVALSGIILSDIATVICAALPKTRVEYYCMSGIPKGVTGSFICTLTIIYSYASDITTPKTRTFKYTMLEIVFGLGMPLGALAGGWMFKFYGYVAVFASSATVNLLCLLWVIFILPETRGLDCKESWSVKMKKFFTFVSLMESYRTTMKRRPHQGRRQILLIILCTCAIFLTHGATTTIAYLYTYHRYDWGNTTYSTVNAIFSLIGLVITLIAVPVFTKVLKLGDPTLGIVGTVSVVGKHIVIALASYPWIYYVGNSIGMLQSLSALAGRSRISKLVSKDDLGKVFSFLSTAESVVPIIGSSVLTIVFNASLSFFPGLVYVVIALLLLCPLGVFIWLALLPLVNYEELKD